MDTPYRHRKGSSGASGRSSSRWSPSDGKAACIFRSRRTASDSSLGDAQRRSLKANALLLNSVGCSQRAPPWAGEGLSPAVGSGGKSTRLDLQWKGGLWGAIEHPATDARQACSRNDRRDGVSPRESSRREFWAAQGGRGGGARDAIPIAEGFLRSKWLLHRPREAEPWTNDKLLNFACDTERLLAAHALCTRGPKG